MTGAAGRRARRRDQWSPPPGGPRPPADPTDDLEAVLSALGPGGRALLLVPHARTTSPCRPWSDALARRGCQLFSDVRYGWWHVGEGVRRLTRLFAPEEPGSELRQGVRRLRAALAGCGPRQG